MNHSHPRHRHGAPFGPWPFLDLEDEVDKTRLEDPYSHIPMSASPCHHKRAFNQYVCWCKYPQSRYPNWTERQQKKSALLKIIDTKTHSCVIHYLDVKKNGMFVDGGAREVNGVTQDNHWQGILNGRSKDSRLRMLFVDDCSGPVLQMIGSRYNVEPFFFSSTIGWTPCRFQSNIESNGSDHITVVFSFIRCVSSLMTEPPSPVTTQDGSVFTRATIKHKPQLTIDIQAPLPIPSTDKILLLDRMALHMVRSRNDSTIISLHPPRKHMATTAETLRTRVHLTGKSVYWCNIFKDSGDPTFVFLSYFWYAVYAWDEAFDQLYIHICHLESQVLYTDQWDTMTRDLHVIRAHLLYFTSLLVDFNKSIGFILQTPNPSFQLSSEDNQGVGDDVDQSEESDNRRKHSENLMNRECHTLLTQIERLEASRVMMELRLKNVMRLGFSRVEIEDNRQRRLLTEAAMKDNAAMKQLTYLTMIFLPAGFCANVFSMNITVINPSGKGTLAQYLAVALPLTAVSIWIIIGYQFRIREPRRRQGLQRGSEVFPTTPGSTTPQQRDSELTLKKLGLWDRVFWPVVLLTTFINRWKRVERTTALGLT